MCATISTSIEQTAEVKEVWSRTSIRTTRWFVKLNGAYRQLHHHGLIEEPALLADYQRAIFAAPLDRPA